MEKKSVRGTRSIHMQRVERISGWAGSGKAAVASVGRAVKWPRTHPPINLAEIGY
jgi:hypothetical protein